MQRRDFLRSAVAATGSAVLLSATPALLAGSSERSRFTRQPRSQFTLHGNKRLGCAGLDFPDDPSLLDTGQFMPRV